MKRSDWFGVSAIVACIFTTAYLLTSSASAQPSPASKRAESTTQGTKLSVESTATPPTTVLDAIAYHTQLIVDDWKCDPLMIHSGINSPRFMTTDIYFGPKSLWEQRGLSVVICSIYAVSASGTLIAHGHSCTRDQRLPDPFSVVLQ